MPAETPPPRRSVAVLATPAGAVPLSAIRPTRAQMRAAYRRNGDPIPGNLRGLLGGLFA